MILPHVVKTTGTGPDESRIEARMQKMRETGAPALRERFMQEADVGPDD